MASRSDRVPSATAVGTAVVVVTGASTELGRRVCELAAADREVERVVALDSRRPASLPDGVEAQQVDLTTADLETLFAGASVIVHLSEPEPPGMGEAISAPTGESRIARRVLDAASGVGATHVVVLSSALVYGAWANNPVPLTEDAPLRPNPGVAAASEKADVELAVADWREAHPEATAAVLRPTVTVSAAGNSWLAKALARSSSLPVVEDEPPAQFLDIADLATAVDLARRNRIDGPRNVAPDGWIDGETIGALAGGPPRVRLPERLALRIAGVRWRFGLSRTPPELLPYTVHPWVVANDRLKADGWEPASTNEEAYVGAHDAGPWATISPRRRQEIALGTAGALLVGGIAGVVALVRRRRR